MNRFYSSNYFRHIHPIRQQQRKTQQQNSHSLLWKKQSLFSINNDTFRKSSSSSWIMTLTAAILSSSSLWTTSPSPSLLPVSAFTTTTSVTTSSITRNTNIYPRYSLLKRRSFVSSSSTLLSSSSSISNNQHMNDKLPNNEMTSSERIMSNDIRSILNESIMAVDPYDCVRSVFTSEFINDDDNDDDNNDDGHYNLILTDRYGKHQDNQQQQQQHRYDTRNYNQVRIHSFGKASSAMTLAVLDILKNVYHFKTKGNNNNNSNIKNNCSTNKKKIVGLKGVVICKDGYCTDDERLIFESFGKVHDHDHGDHGTADDDNDDIIELWEASHPIPDDRSSIAANRILTSATSASAATTTTSSNNKNQYQSQTLIINCISGGGSALFCSPIPPLTVSHLSSTNDILLKSGMDIRSMNIIRRLLELGKGGKLVSQYCYPNTCINLVLSDVIGDPLDLVASGPTVDPSSGGGFQEAWDIVEQYKLDGRDYSNSLPKEVLDVIRQGMVSSLSSTSSSLSKKQQQGQTIFNTPIPKISTTDTSTDTTTTTTMMSETILAGNNVAAVQAAAKKAKELGYDVTILGSELEGEASLVALDHVDFMERMLMNGNGDTRDNNNGNSKEDSSGSSSKKKKPRAFVVGGETTVTIPSLSSTSTSTSTLTPIPTGNGGRNQHLCLVAAIEMYKRSMRNVIIGSIGTDGTDGPDPTHSKMGAAAGAVVDGGLIGRWNNNKRSYTRENDMDATIMTTTSTNFGAEGTTWTTPNEAVKEHDSYGFFLSCGGDTNDSDDNKDNYNSNDSTTMKKGSTADSRGSSDEYKEQDNINGNDDNNPLIRTGPTGTNVADVCVMLIR